jgi:mRNA-degrading endonuclease RelE of RelBE toxin-antitoxin system
MTDKIQKFIQSLDEKTRLKVHKRLGEIIDNTIDKKQRKKLQGQRDVYRVRIGKIRILYKQKKDDIEIVDIDYRGNVY